jgi:hypothetical protein
VIGLAMLAIFAVCALLMWARILPAILALPVMAIAIALVAGVGPAGIAAMIIAGSSKLAPLMVTVIFGALLSRVTIQTGVAETIVNYAAEFGGDQPVWLALLLCAVVALLFSSLYGLGAIIMVGSIVLPIMMTTGVPRSSAAALFMLSYALGFIFNISQWKFYTQVFDVQRADLLPFAYALAAIDAVALLVFVVVDFRRTRGYATWALPKDEPIAKRSAPPLALLTPLVPLALYFGLNVDPLIAFPIAALWGVIFARPKKTIEILVSSAIRGVEDVAPALLLFIGIGILLATIAQPQVAGALKPAVSAIAPRNAVSYVVLFGLLSPLALYRGPLNLYGVGIGVYTVLAQLGLLPHAMLAAAAMAVVQVQNACDPTNTQNVWVANFTGVRVNDLTRATLPYQVAVATLATIVAVLAMPFPAAAATVATAGLSAPAASANTFAIAHADDPESARAADQVEHQISRGWSGFQTMRLSEDPSASDCSTKTYVAVLRTVAAGDDLGLYLTDCAGWPIDEWHGSVAENAGNGALALLIRLRNWIHEHPARAAALFKTGVAFDPKDDAPTFFLSLVKTPDGQMRAYARPGGPAYAAGLRTNDIVEKIDGRFWWEYGTYASQRRAYDGLPHAFVVTRGGRTLEVRLGAPYDGE